MAELFGFLAAVYLIVGAVATFTSFENGRKFNKRTLCGVIFVCSGVALGFVWSKVTYETSDMIKIGFTAGIVPLAYTYLAWKFRHLELKFPMKGAR